MGSVANKRILVGITGSIAAYKAAELVRRLGERGAQVRVVMTRGATQFVTPLTLQALSGHPVRSELWDPEAEAAMGHISLARWADRILVAPASADFLARLAHGRADDLLAALCLAAQAPILVAPAMNQAMWAHPATQANCQILMDRGVSLLGPATGAQACGETGEGRLLEADALIDALEGSFAAGALDGCRVVVTAGPTREALDPVRYLSNRSSGQMGFAVARAAAEAGARVTLVAGPVNLATPAHVTRVDVESAQQMYEAVMARAADCDVFVGAAAVADFRPARVSGHKLKKDGDAGTSVQLEPAPDILAAVAETRPAPFTVGFAAETKQVIEYAEAKRRAKGLDMIAANRVGPGMGFEAPDNALEVLWGDGAASLARAPKDTLARKLIELIAERYHAKDPTKDS